MELKTQRYKLIIEYDGTNYLGFQKQPRSAGKSIELELLEAIEKLTGEKVDIFVSGRTDAGVHAFGQVIHFDLHKKMPPERIVAGLNNYLREEEIAILSCEKVDESFHARFGSKMRHYRYIVVNRHSPPVLQKNRVWHVAKKLDVDAMKKAAKHLLGTHDFSAFRDAECQAKTPIRTILKIEVHEQNGQIIFDVSAKSFLHHMVRNIVGTLVWCGLEKIQPEEMKEILENKDRTKSGPNAPACGLYFTSVDYQG
jgi:tRNA pseudouridine38-40 synthase